MALKGIFNRIYTFTSLNLLVKLVPSFCKSVCSQPFINLLLQIFQSITANDDGKYSQYCVGFFKCNFKCGLLEFNQHFKKIITFAIKYSI